VSTRAWSLFAGVSVVWGVPYLLIKIAGDGGMPPLALAWSRMLVGAAILLALAARAGSLGALRGHWRALLAYALVELAIPFPLIAFGERRLASSLAAIIIATVPLLVALIAIRLEPSERVTGRRLTGLLVGLAGVVLLVGLDGTGSSHTLVAVGAVLVAACGYAGGPLILRRHLSDLEPAAAMGASLAIAALLLTPLALLDLPSRMPTAGAFAADGGLAVVCTAAGFVLMAMLIAEIGPSRAVVITYINPVVALALGTLLLGEHPGVGALAGLALILCGSWLSTDGRLPRRRRRDLAAS
jgi:drug/metabolite transporter (DMT)-like permease